MYRILEFFQANPRANVTEAVKRFEEEFQVKHYTKVLNDELKSVQAIKNQARPLYAERRDVDEQMRFILSEIEGEIFMEYPPRKGSEAQRDTMRNRLMKENVDYMELKARYRGLTERIDECEDKLKDIEMETKTARRMLDVFQSYLGFITTYMKTNS